MTTAAAITALKARIAALEHALRNPTDADIRTVLRWEEKRMEPISAKVLRHVAERLDAAVDGAKEGPCNP